MSVYPFELDDDATLPRVDDNITETGQEAINALRDAVFNVQETLGIEPQGSVTSVANRLDASLNPDGTIKASALTSIGLVTLPITNSQVASNAGILESKLQLVHSTTSLYTLIVVANSLINNVASLVNTVNSDFNLHRVGSTFLSDGSTSARHVLSHIDLNAIPNDSRDVSFTWTGLKDKNNNLRVANNAAQGLLAVNDALTSHENAVSGSHVASAIVVNTDDFSKIPLTATDAQSVFNYLDQTELLNIGQHLATQHANAVPKIARADVIDFDGYGHNVVPLTTCYAYLNYPSSTVPVDDLFVGDDLVKFVPVNASNEFDAAFSQVRVGDIIRVNYGNGLEAIYPVESIRFTPGSEWYIRINGVNLCNATDGYATARIDRALYDVDTAGIFATAAANARFNGSPAATSTLSSLIVADPRGAMALGLGFDAGQINSTHYNLYLEFYPSGNPDDKTIAIPAIDVSGNAGATPGKYTITSIVANVNDKFREFGYNLRFIAFDYNGEFGLMLADSINQASFAIIRGDNSSGTLLAGSYSNNVIGGNSLDTFDALGLGPLGANLASPAYLSSWVDATAALLPTKVIRPLKKRFAIVNGNKLDKFQEMYLTTDGYWDGYIASKSILPTTVETTYIVSNYLAPSGIKAGKTIIVQPAISFSDPDYSDADYGRFIVKSVNFVGACGTSPAYTQITVLNSVSTIGAPVYTTAEPPLPVRIYFSYDSVGFNNENIINTSPTLTDYKRFHEVYLTDKGKTFSHERLRMPIQTETGTLLLTNNIHIMDVSPKLRGYTDNSSLVGNKYLRFYVLNYDSSTGEFDGYLGRRDSFGTQIYDTGKVVTGKKNVITRFYDETNIDYVDVLFEDFSSNPGISVLSSSVPRYVDIEVFSSLRTDDELLLLSTCEVNWDPLSGENIVQYVQDRRQFGSVDEVDFTDSAKDYIAAANKYLHDNGVISGLDYVSNIGSGELRFNGGSAIIAGKVINANNQTVTIPQITIAYPSATSTLNWAICLREDGNLVPIILTASKQLTFVTNSGGPDYQALSLTFNEIINDRKDLCLIYIANVTIASITVNSVSDARKFVDGLDLAAPLVWSSDQEFNGNFYSIDALKYWINNSNGTNNHVKLRGIFNITDSLILSGFTKTVLFDGSNADVTVTTSGAGKGILLGSNLHLENWKITYAPTGFSVGSPVVGISSTTGCLLFQTGNISNLRIRKCSFQSTVDAFPAFITINYNRGNVLEDIIIDNNTFDSTSVSLTAPYYQPAIQLFSSETSGSTAAVLKNIIIKNNYSKKYHGILITRNLTNTPGTRVSAIIEGNTCGYIGYSFGSNGVDASDPNYGLIIKNNFTKFIGTFTGYTPTLIPSYSQSLGPVLIEGNNCSWLRCQMFETSTEKTSLSIKNNTFFADDYLFLDAFFGLGGGATRNIAIYVYNNNPSPYANKVSFKIEGNTVDYGRKSSTTYGYDCAIQLQGNCDVTNNNFGGINSSQYMMYCQKPSYSETYYFNINNNNFFRRTTTILGYIKYDGDVSPGITSGQITKNVFDSTTIDGTSTNLIIEFIGGVASATTIYDNLRWTAVENKNQTVEIFITSHYGQLSLGNEASPNTNRGVTSGKTDVFSGNGHISTATNQNCYISQNTEPVGGATDATLVAFSFGTTDRIRFKWEIPCNGLIPYGAELISANIGYVQLTTSSVSMNNSPAYLIISKYANGVETSATSSSVNIATGSSYSITATASSNPSLNPIIKHNNLIVLKFYIDADSADASIPRIIEASAIKLKFKYN